MMCSTVFWLGMAHSASVCGSFLDVFAVVSGVIIIIIGGGGFCLISGFWFFTMFGQV